MKESVVENHFCWSIERIGGKTWKFVSPSNRGVSDRIACLPNGETWFVELKKPIGGRLSELQKIFAAEMQRLNQHYTVLWTKEQVDEFVRTHCEHSGH